MGVTGAYLNITSNDDYNLMRLVTVIVFNLEACFFLQKIDMVLVEDIFFIWKNAHQWLRPTVMQCTHHDEPIQQLLLFSMHIV